ncbi:MAG TPA: choice-of-anchor X domain-containing protein [Bacteroidota bacterium]
MNAFVSPDTIDLGLLTQNASVVQFVAKARIARAPGSSQLSEVTFSLADLSGSTALASGILHDDGIAPDQSAGDSIFSGQFSVSVQSLVVGIYYCQISAKSIQGYGSNSYQLPIAIGRYTSNHSPVISNLQAPDTILVGGHTQQFRLMVKATDADGQSDIARVFFNSFKPDGSPASGNPFLMYDDGSQVILYPPDFTSGDDVKGDGIYTLTVLITTSNAPGTYRFEFQAVDRSNAFSQKIVHNIQVVQ